MWVSGSMNPKRCLSTQELSELTPWSEQEIRSMISRGIPQLGIHYFMEMGSAVV